MRILIAADTFPPLQTSGAILLRDLTGELIRQGHAPTVVVPAPDLARRWVLETAGGVQVLRVRTARTKDVGLLRRALAEAVLPLALLRGLRASPLRDVRWDGLVWYSPTIFLGPMVSALKRRNGCRGYLILRDLFPDWAVDAGILRKGLAYRFFKWVERYQYQVADVIGVQTPANAPLVQKDNQGTARIEVLNNWLADPVVSACGIDVAKTPLAGRTVFVYTGNMGAAQGMDGLIELATRMRPRADVGFLFVGRGSDVPRLREMASERSLDNVVFMDEVASNSIPGLLAQCHVGLIALDPRHTTHNIPGKLLTYLRAGLPVLARINAGNDLEGVVHDEGVGYAVTGDSAHALHAYAEQLADDASLRGRMSVRGRVLAERMFSPESAVRQVVAGLVG